MRFAIKELEMTAKVGFFETIYSLSQKSEVCPMPYALCPMPMSPRIFLRKAITAYLTAAPLWSLKTVCSECDRPAPLSIALRANN